MKRLTAAALLAAALALAPTAAAQPLDPAAAEALFRAGREAADRHDYAAARAKFLESQRLDPAPGTLLNIADCEEHLGLVASAWEHLVAAADQLPRGDDRVPFTRARIASVERRLPRLTLTLSPLAPAGTRVLRDGVEVRAAALGVPVPVDPGEHEIVVLAPGRARSSSHVAVREAETKEVALEPGDETALPWPTAQARGDAPAAGQGGGAPAPGAEGGSSDPRGTLGLVLGGVGAAGLAVGAVAGIMAFGAGSTFKANCDASGACNQQGLDAASSGKTLTTVSTVSFVLGLAAGGAGAYFFLTRDRGGRPTTALVTTGAPGGGGLSLVRAF